MVKHLLDTGKWLKYSGDCVYDTVKYRILALKLGVTLIHRYFRIIGIKAQKMPPVRFGS